MVIELNKREVEILTWSARGLTSIEIARKTGLSKRTVDAYTDSARTKLQALTRTHAVVKALLGRLIKP
jgi:DNA-binding CsgD family transcriptional regulator